MGRKSRRLHVRIFRAALVIAGGAFAYHRWQLRPFGMQTASADAPAAASELCTSSADGSVEERRQVCAPRAQRWSQLSSSSAEHPFDMLVIGAGLIGLYTAVDAAQRGLRVALVDAADIGGGSTTSEMPSTSPGAFPYVQRAIRQRDLDWLRVATTVLTEEATWRNAAPTCVVGPATMWQRIAASLTGRTGSRRTAEGEHALSDGLPPPPSFPPAATTLLPALHSSEMLEYASAAVLSTLLSFLCGPLQLNSVLSPSAVRARLPGLLPTTASNGSALRVKGGVVTTNVELESHAAAVALALTAAELGVVVCTYCPVTAVEEVEEERSAKHGGGGQDRASWWTRSRWRHRRTDGVAASCGTRVLVATVQGALAPQSAALTTKTTADHTAASAAAPSNLLSRWFSPRRKSNDATSTSDADVHRPTTSTHASAQVYARSVVNCAGCRVDSVKALYAGNAQDTVPSAFGGYLAYSYLVAPADAVYAAAAASKRVDQVPAADAAHDTSFDVAQKAAEASTLPLSGSTHTAGLHFSSPRLSFASAMVLPWWDRCVLLGPSISVLAPQPPEPHQDASLSARQATPGGAAEAALRTMSVKDTGDNANGTMAWAASSGTLLPHSSDGFTAQRERITSMLESCGVVVDTPRLLSCVTQTVPYLRSPQEVPFQREMLKTGYAVRFSSLLVRKGSNAGDAAVAVSAGGDGGAAAESAGDDEVRRDVPFLHVYGGTPVLARRIAQDAVDAVIRHPTALPHTTTQELKKCRTHRLRLTTPAHVQTSDAQLSATSAQTRLKRLIEDTFAERLTDVVARRTHVAYTSPEEALAALPAVTAVMASLKQWSAEKQAAEVAAVRRLIAAVAIFPAQHQ